MRNSCPGTHQDDAAGGGGGWGGVLAPTDDKNTDWYEATRTDSSFPNCFACGFSHNSDMR